MQRWFVALLLVTSLVAVPGPAAAHVNDIEADDQVSADGEIRVESTSIPTDGYLVVHSVTDDGGIGDPIGRVALSAGRQYTDLTVGVDANVWASWNGSRDVWLVLHRRGDQSGFQPADDPIQRSLGGVAGDRITVAKERSGAVVLAEGFTTQTAGETVTVRRVVTPEPATLTLRVDRATGLGPTIAATSLPAGVYENVTLRPTTDLFGPNRTGVTLYAGLARADGAPITVGDRQVGSYFPVVEPVASTPDIVTSTPGSETPASAATEQPTDVPGTTAEADGPGFGTGVALFALVTVAVRAGRR